MNEREHAFAVLQRVERDGAFASLAIDALNLDERDAAFVRTIVLGVLRWRSRLDWIVGRLSDRTVGQVDAAALQILRIGLYQLLLMDVPSHAAVFETVALAGRHARRAKGFVNAVLRRAAGADLANMLPRGDSAGESAVRLGHPEWLLQRWILRYGPERALSIAQANQQLSYPDLLVNTGRISVADALALMETRGMDAAPSELVPGVIRLRSPAAPLAVEIGAGLFHPMDEGSAVISSLVGSPAGPVLDAAAAPGGKSLALMSRDVDVVAHDVSWRRLRMLARIAPRMFGSGARIVVGDGRMPPFRTLFDAVILDAPCSATGTVRKNPEIRWRLEPVQIASFAALQVELLRRALDLTRGECIYSTCSLEPEENDEVIDAALAGRPEFRRVDLGDRVGAGLRKWVEDGVLRLTPDAGTDGFTAFALRRER